MSPMSQETGGKDGPHCRLCECAGQGSLTAAQATPAMTKLTMMVPPFDGYFTLSHVSSVFGLDNALIVVSSCHIDSRFTLGAGKLAVRVEMSRGCLGSYWHVCCCGRPLRAYTE